MAVPWQLLSLLAGTALLLTALRQYDAARNRFDRAAIQATSSGCYERVHCPQPLLDVLPSALVGATGVTVLTVALAAALWPRGRLEGGPGGGRATDQHAPAPAHPDLDVYP